MKHHKSVTLAETSLEEQVTANNKANPYTSGKYIFLANDETRDGVTVYRLRNEDKAVPEYMVFEQGFQTDIDSYGVRQDWFTNFNDNPRDLSDPWANYAAWQLAEGVRKNNAEIDSLEQATAAAETAADYGISDELANRTRISRESEIDEIALRMEGLTLELITAINWNRDAEFENAKAESAASSDLPWLLSPDYREISTREQKIESLSKYLKALSVRVLALNYLP
ncbi:MAG: hypothetical protein V4726_01045 [Verrucomicrobiota bacterium]